ncbi:MAG: DUF362 domain-containing protein [Endomicrobiales bacterium]|nr:DUF362 domain-containing protein [Endomicrobiales bacterium]
MNKTKISMVKCGSYGNKEVSEAVRKAVELIGGIGKFVKKGEKILVKPNLLSARQPERHVTTHPEIVRAIVRLIKEAGAVPRLGDSPGGAVKGVDRVWQETGMKELAIQENIELINFETYGSVEAGTGHPSVPSVRLTKAAFDCDGIINVPKLKTHGLQIFTGAVKNLYGLLPGLQKAEYHKKAPHPDDFGHLLARIYMLVKDRIRFTLVDGIIGMEGNGPSSGELKKMDLVSACGDGHAMDWALTKTLGFDPLKIDSVRFAEKLLARKTRLEDIETCGDGPEEFGFRDFRFPSNWYIHLVPKFFIDMLGSLIWLKPEIIPEACTSCMMCVNSCPVNAIIKEGGNKPYVVQKGCISCLCCHELCQYKAIRLTSSFLAKFLIRH